MIFYKQRNATKLQQGKKSGEDKTRAICNYK